MKFAFVFSNPAASFRADQIAALRQTLKLPFVECEIPYMGGAVECTQDFADYDTLLKEADRAARYLETKQNLALEVRIRLESGDFLSRDQVIVLLAEKLAAFAPHQTEPNQVPQF